MQTGLLTFASTDQEQTEQLFHKLYCLVEQKFLTQACCWLGAVFQSSQVACYSRFLPVFPYQVDRQSEVVLTAYWSEQGSRFESRPPSCVLKVAQLESTVEWVEVPLPIAEKLSDSDETSCYVRDWSGTEVSLRIPPPPDEQGLAAFFRINGVHGAHRLSVQELLERVPAESLQQLLQRASVEVQRIQQRKRQESELSTLRAVISCVPGLVLAKDKELRYFLVNQEICRYNATAPEHMIGKRFEDLPWLAPNPDITQSDERALAGEHVKIEFPLKNFDETHIFHCEKAPIKTEEGVLMGLCSVCLDVTDLKNLEQELSRANAFQSAVIENSVEGICVLTQDQQVSRVTCSLWNRRLVEITGLEHPHRHPVRSFRVLFEAAEYLRFLRVLARLRRGKPKDSRPFVIHRPDGVRRVVMLSTAEITEATGRKSYVGFVHDITASHEYQLSLQQIRERYELATKYSQVSVWEYQVAEQTLYNDGNLSRILGHEPADTITREYWLQYIHPEDLPVAGRNYRDFIEGRAPRLNMRFRMLHADGSWRWIDSEGQFVGGDHLSGVAIGTNRDVTQQVLAAERIRDLQQEILQITRLTTVGEAAASLAHELTQPVTAIRSYAAAARKQMEEQVATGQEQDEIHKYVARIENSAENVAHILRGIRSLCSQSALERNACRLGELIDSALELTLPELKKRNVILKRLTAADQQIVNAHPQLIIHVLLNLIQNACRILEQVPEKFRCLRLSTHKQGEQICIRVTDSGPGVSPEIVHRLFQPFVTTREDGMGMGLAICKRIVEAHDGTIQLQQREDALTEFVIELPEAETVNTSVTKPVRHSTSNSHPL